ncbi:DUF3060 domain-containing protein [Curtobacterium sp. VKM Ac-2887]|uniref:DUF3060 domain-containing protein n=1 Tax=Curtobacterium sp. VKM Ac-2887 TaxID=2783819 RepID=UPI00188D6E6E|nr:DUF3060 domain-containing protein [Curtobacterium sp. VKM Ac-2887]MBF4587106.1 DUF3060 domain-containing protein [Curtobacterium sp. VKM Ac-2887]
MRHTSRTARIAATTLAAIGILTVVTACSGTGGDEPTKKPTAECADGKVVIDQSNKDVTVGDCASVEITASNAVVHLGKVDALVMSGTINDVDAKEIGKVTVSGNGNRVTTDGKPKVTDKGAENLFVTR